MQLMGKRISLIIGHLFGLMTCATLSNAAFANSEYMKNLPFYIPPDWGFAVATFSAGAAFSSDAGRSQNFHINSINRQYNFSADTDHTSALIGGFFGSEFYLRPNFDLQLGLGYYEPTTFHLRGTVRQGPGTTPTATESDYRYEVDVHQMLVEAKLLYKCLGRFHPYVSGGVGATFNNANDYFDNIAPPFNNHFDGQVNAAFSYNVGLGLDYDVSQHWRLGVGYRFSDFGEIKAGDDKIGNTGAVIAQNEDTLHQSHFYANEVFGQLSYLFN